MSNYWETLRQREISRRTMLGASAKAGVGAAGLALVGCGDDDDDAGTAAAERAAAAAEEAAAAAVAAGEARAAETEAAADAAAEAAAAASEASAAASQAADAADAAAALAAEAAESEDAANAAAAAEAAAAAAAQAAEAASAAGDEAAAAVAAAASEAAEAAAQAARDAAAAVEAGTATAAAAQAAIDEAAEAAAAAAAAAGEASAAAGEAAATAQQTAEAAAETAAAAVAAAQEAADAAQEAAESAATAAATEDQPEAIRNGWIIQGWGSNSFHQLDPVTGSGGDDHQHIRVGHDSIIGYNPDLVPDASRSLAASWELADPEGLTIVFTQKPDVRFHDGTPVNGEAVKISMDRARTLEVGNTRADMQFVENIEVTDDLTTTWSMSQPFAPLFRILGMRAGMLVSPKKIAESDDFLNREPTGAGAHKFVEEVDGDRLVFEANDDYWKPNAPLVNGVRWEMGLSTEQITNALLAGDTNVQIYPDPATLPTIEDAGLVVRSKPTNYLHRYWINSNMEPWTNPHLRRAVNWAVDKQALVDVVWNGIGTPAHWGWLGPATGPDHDPNYEGYVKNPDKVREELALAGFPDGFEFDMNGFDFATWIARDEFIQAQLAEFGIIVNLDTKPSPQFWREYFDLEASGHSSTMSTSADVYWQMAWVHDPLGPHAFGVPEDPNDPDRVAVTAGLQAVAQAFDPDERFTEMQKLNRALDEAAWGANWFYRWAVYAHPEEVEFEIFPDGYANWGQDNVRINA